MKKLSIIIILILTAFAAHSQPRNMQVRVKEVTQIKGNKVDCWGLNMQGDTVYLKIGFRSMGKVREVKVGSWITVYANWDDRKCTWITTRICLNN